MKQVTKMSMDEFRESLIEDFRRRDVNLKFTPNVMDDVNGLKRESLIVQQEGENVGVVLYLNNAHERVIHGKVKLEEAMETLWKQFNRADTTQIGDVSSYLSTEDAKRNIIFRMLNWELNKETILMKRQIYKRVGNTDLVVVFRICVLSGKDGEQGYITLTEELLHHYMSEFEDNLDGLYQLAVKNMENSVQVCNLMELLKGRSWIPDECQVNTEMYMVSSADNHFGAGAILTQTAKERLRVLFGQQKLLVLPSSVAEVIVLPWTDTNLTYYKKMVEEVNETQLEPYQVLSENVYFYNLTDGSLVIATEEESTND